MTDLPRFHKGQLGPLDFQTLNEVMRRLDALQPLVESTSISEGATKYREDVPIPVYAERINDDTSPNNGRFLWWALLVRGNERDVWDDDPDTIATKDATDWDLITEVSQFRFGNEANNATAISTDSNFSSGYGFVIPYRRTDTSRIWIFIPSETRAIDMLLIREVVEQSQELTGKSGPNLFCSVYRVSRIAIGEDDSIQYDDGSGDDLLLYDFGHPQPPNTINLPTLSGSDATLTPRVFDVNTVVMGLSIGNNRYAASNLTHLDVTCGGAL